MSKGEVERITDIGTVFRANTEITNFDEFESFTGIELLGDSHSETTNVAPFYQCTNLESIKFPESLKTIRGNSFRVCSKLKIDSLPASITYIGENAFIACDLDGFVVDAPNLTTLGNGAFAETNIARVENLGSITVTGSASGNNQYNGTFRQCTKLTFARLPNTLKDTGISMFYQCSALEECIMSSAIEYIRDWAFNSCSSLTKCNIPESVVSIGPNAFGGCSLLEFDELNLPNLTSLGQNAFYGVKIKKLVLGALTELPASTTSAQNFGDKSILEEVIIPDGVTIIPQNSFYAYSTLKRVHLPSTLTGLNSSAFSDCFALESIELGENMTLLSAAALFKCTSLAYIICRATTPPTMGNVNALGNTNNCPIYVPDASVDAYKAAENWSTYADRIYPISVYEGGE